MQALERAGAVDNTLLIFSSDNGPEGSVPDDEGVYERVRHHNHHSMGPLRGMKRDVWEGGHRVPLLAAWPQVIPAGSRCDQLVGLGDLMATCAEIIGATLPQDAGEDSVSMLSLLRGQVDQPTREEIVHHSRSGKFAIRCGPWVYIGAPSGSHNQEPDWWQQRRGYEPHEWPGELFDLTDDLAEHRNQYGNQPELVRALAARLEQIKAGHDTTINQLADEHLAE